MKCYIIKTGSPPAAIKQAYGDMDDFIKKGMGQTSLDIEVIVSQDNEALPAIDDCAGAIITGSSAMVTDRLDWSVEIEAWIRAIIAAGIPLLGICYGHQLIAQAAGGKVGNHPQGDEIGTVAIQLLPAAKEDKLFKTMPDVFPAQAIHTQTVLTLPPNAIRLAKNDYEPNHAFRLGKCVYGVQFHPEFNQEIMQAYLNHRRTNLGEQKTQQLLQQSQDSTAAAHLLEAFAAIVQQYSET